MLNYNSQLLNFVKILFATLRKDQTTLLFCMFTMGMRLFFLPYVLMLYPKDLDTKFLEY